GLVDGPEAESVLFVFLILSGFARVNGGHHVPFSLNRLGIALSTFGEQETGTNKNPKDRCKATHGPSFLQGAKHCHQFTYTISLLMNNPRTRLSTPFAASCPAGTPAAFNLSRTWDK